MHLVATVPFDSRICLTIKSLSLHLSFQLFKNLTIKPLSILEVETYDDPVKLTQFDLREIPAVETQPETAAGLFDFPSSTLGSRIDVQNLVR